MDYMEVFSSNMNFFEGTEKLLEIWFTRKDGDLYRSDLRDVPRQKWDSLLKLVKCEVISFSQNDDIDAYVLSESSMFVAKQRFILKTCGTTTLLNCVKPLLQIVKQYTNFDEVQDFYYSRKNFLRPELQKTPHTSFDEEVKVLDNLFPDGAAYCLGRMNRDCWYLYTLNPLNSNGRKRGVQQPDQTLEVLMTELDPEVMKIFTKEVCSSAREATELSGIHKLLPNVHIDDFLFEPCGYSMNGILNDGHYMTIHITPETHCSYVSFETNIPQTSYNDLIMRIINTFHPGKFLMTILANKTSLSSKSHKDVRKTHHFGDYNRQDIQFCKFKNYDLTYALYAKFPS